MIILLKRNRLLLNSIVLAIKFLSIIYTIDLLTYHLEKEIAYTYRANQTFNKLVFTYGCFSIIILTAFVILFINLKRINKPVKSICLGIIITSSIGLISKFYTEGDILFDKISYFVVDDSYARILIVIITFIIVIEKKSFVMINGKENFIDNKNEKYSDKILDID